MTTRELLSGRTDDIQRVAASQGAESVRVLGSVARGEARPDSDVDFLVRLETGRDLLDLVAIKQDRQELLGPEVDVVEEGGLSPYLRERILDEARPL
jgi:uncharacterized protein